MDRPILAMQSVLEEYLPPALEAVVEASGEAGFKRIPVPEGHRVKKHYENVNGRLRLMADGVGAPKFDVSSPKAQAWIREHAAETIAGISNATRDMIRGEIETAFEGEFDVDELAARIEAAVGDAARAETIARTETMRASNQGQQEAWAQAKDQGLLSGREQQEWIVTPDDRLCPICESLDGQQVGLDEPFETDDGEQFDGPPAHPNCRCTIGLTDPGEA